MSLLKWTRYHIILSQQTIDSKSVDWRVLMSIEHWPVQRWLDNWYLCNSHQHLSPDNRMCLLDTSDITLEQWYLVLVHIKLPIFVLFFVFCIFNRTRTHVFISLCCFWAFVSNFCVDLCCVFPRPPSIPTYATWCCLLVWFLSFVMFFLCICTAPSWFLSKAVAFVACTVLVK